MRVTRNFFRVFPLRYHVGNATAQWALYRCRDSIRVSTCKGNIIIEEKGRFQENIRKMLGLPTPDRLPSISLTRYGICSREGGKHATAQHTRAWPGAAGGGMACPGTGCLGVTPKRG